MKKVTKTITTTPAVPAPVPVKKASEKPAAKVLAPVKATLPKPVAAPAVKAVPASVATTKIVAQIDVGFGNTLYVRGEGAGLSWEKGVPLDCIADDQWSLSLSETSRPVVFKFLINDLTWSLGEDYVVQPGSSVALTPTF
jgi:hypothetical protein